MLKIVLIIYLYFLSKSRYKMIIFLCIICFGISKNNYIKTKKGNVWLGIKIIFMFGEISVNK